MSRVVVFNDEISRDVLRAFEKSQEPKFYIACQKGNRKILSSCLGFNKPGTLEKLAAALNLRFPARHYSVVKVESLKIPVVREVC